jgi:general secretion pathway protein D
MRRNLLPLFASWTLFTSGLALPSAYAEAENAEEGESEASEEEGKQEPPAAEQPEQEQPQEEQPEEQPEEAPQEGPPPPEAPPEPPAQVGPPPPPDPPGRTPLRARPTQPAKPAARTAAPIKRAPDEEAPLPGAVGAPPSTMEAIAQEVDVPYRPKPGGHLIKFNLEDADLAELVNHISGLTGKRFIYGAKVRQIKVTVVSPTPVTLNEAYEAFLSILQANGMTVVPHGRFLKIVDTGGVVTQTTPIVSRGEPVPDTDRIVTRLYRLKHADSEEIAKVLNKFKSKEGDITTYPASNLLIITDTGANTRRMIRLIEEVDVGGSASKMWIEPVHYGAAADLSKQLNEIYELGKGGGDSGLEKVIAEEQTNSLIIVGNEESYLRLLELLKRVDVSPASEGRIHVLPLQHANSAELAKTLTQMLGAETKGGKGGAAAAGAPEAEMFEGNITITEDKATNSLVISSSARDFAQLRLVVEKLDQKRRQVFLEAVIMDVSVNRSSSLNLAYHGAATSDIVGGEESVILGGFNPGASILPGADQLQALALNVRGPEVDAGQAIPGLPPGVSIPAFGVFLNALARSGDSNVLSTPHVIAMDNTEAEINIGENVPLQQNVGGGFNPASLAQAAGGAGANAGALAGLAGLGGFNFNSQRADVGTKVKITPHINDENQVRLEIQEEISETGSPQGALGAVPITQRTAKTTVVVDDQQTVVIGGLMRDTKSKSSDKIPILGDLPVLGFLFRSSRETMVKTNLLLILTPHVIRDQRDLRQIFQRKMQERQQFLDRYFVFTSEWEPPRDFTRTNGLVEDIRQAYVALEERARIERESQPSELQIHQASEPLELAGALKPGAGGTPATRGATTPAKKAAPEKKTAPAPAQPKQQQQRVRGRRKVGEADMEAETPPLVIQRVARSVGESATSDGVTDPPGPPVSGDPIIVDRVE